MANCCTGPAERSTSMKCPKTGWAGTRRTTPGSSAPDRNGAAAIERPRLCLLPGCRMRCRLLRRRGLSVHHGRSASARLRKCAVGDRQICYCFGESEASIHAEFESAGTSGAVDRIREHISAGGCACEIKNPRGACCLGDVIAAVARIQVESTTAAPLGEGAAGQAPVS